MTDSGGDTPGTGSRIEITGGGTPTAEDLAALVAALASMASPPVATRATPPWARAALLEAVGGSRVTAPHELEAGEGWLGEGDRRPQPSIHGWHR